MKRSMSIARSTLVLALLLDASCQGGCGKSSADASPAATPATVAPPSALRAPTAPPPNASAAPSASVGNTGRASLGILAGCCRILSKSAESEPNPLQRSLMLQGAANCEKSVKDGNEPAATAELRKYGVNCR